jgi:hypothetical protein
LEVWGAQGAYNGGTGGKGGYSAGNYNGNGTMYVCVGGMDGYNGGGPNINLGQNGGGATHIAITTNRGILSSYKNNQSEVILVAGGGGGANDNGTGGSGGGTTGGTGTTISNNVSVVGATGGTQTAGGTFTGKIYTNQVVVSGSFGQGGYSTCTSSQPTDTGGSGGGGWYGGGGTPYSGCGGGGSGHINTSKISSGSMSNGIQSGNGKALITWMPVL